MKQKDIEHRVRQITWPAPSAGLRDRVLSAAVVPQQSITWSDRMWFSRTWRLLAVAATLVVVALEYVSGSSQPAALAPSPQAQAEARAVQDIGRQAGLSAELASALARRASSQPSTVQTPSAVLQAFDLDGTGAGR